MDEAMEYKLKIAAIVQEFQLNFTFKKKYDDLKQSFVEKKKKKK